MTIAPDASRRVETTPTIDPAHAAALAELATIADRVRYACEHNPDGPRTDSVRQWLAAHGYDTKRPYVSTLVTGYRSSRDMADTGDLPTLTDDVLAELDAANPADVATSEPVETAVPDQADDDVPQLDLRPSGPEPTASIGEQVRRRPWPLIFLALPAFVAVWSGWVGIGRLTGFGLVNLLPGIVDDGGWSTIDTAITLPIGVEAYGAYALSVWLSGRVPARARRFAFWSAIGSLLVGMAGQGAYHLMIANPQWLDVADGTQSAPWPIVVLVSCLPVAVLGMGAALAHLVRSAD